MLFLGGTRPCMQTCKIEANAERENEVYSGVQVPHWMTAVRKVVQRSNAINTDVHIDHNNGEQNNSIKCIILLEVVLFLSLSGFNLYAMQWFPRGGDKAKLSTVT